MEREEYILRVLRDHLMHEDPYQQLQPCELEFQEDMIRNRVRNIIMQASQKKLLKENEITDLRRAVSQCTHVSQFYITMKLHKAKLGLRPVIGSGGLLLAAISKLVDVYLQPLTEFSFAYIGDWEHLLDQMEKLDMLLKGAKLFTADATSMYTNIDTEHGLEVLLCWLNKLKEEKKIVADYPMELIVELTALVMRNNHFGFGDTNWLQLIKTAMGTPMACVYATIYFVLKEMGCILPRFKDTAI